MNVSFDFPKNMKWKDFPLIQEPKFKVNDIEQWYACNYSNGELNFIDVSFEEIAACEKIIYAAEPTGSSAYLFKVFVEKIFQKSLNEVNPLAVYLFSLDYNSIAEELENLKDFNSCFEKELKVGEISKYFDYNYNLNSLVLFGRIISEVKKKYPEKSDLIGEVFVSKNMIQLLYFIMRNENAGKLFSVNKILAAMHKWEGTGKYKDFDKRVILGSHSSCFSIVTNWLDCDFIQLNEGKISLGDRGKYFMSLLPKDCMDLDLPYRISLWKDESETEFESAKKKVEKYLFTYFNKVKNKSKGLP